MSDARADTDVVEEEQTTAIAPRESQQLHPSLAKFIAEGMEESLVRRAAFIKFKDVPMPVVVRTLDMAHRYELDPMRDEIEVIETWNAKAKRMDLKPFITLKGYERKAHQHPDFIGVSRVERSDDVDPNGNPIKRCTVWLKRLKAGQTHEVGPFFGKKDVFLPKKNNAPANELAKANEWAEETAFSRALRSGLRFTFGIEIPEDNDLDAPWTDDQRKFLFGIAALQAWDDPERHRQAAAVLGRDVTTWSTLTRDEAMQLQIAWQHFREDVIDVETGEITSPTPEGDQTPEAEESNQADRSPRDTHVAASESQTSLPQADPPESDRPSEKATERQLTLLAVIADEFEWDDETRRARAGVASFNDLTKQAAADLIADWIAKLDSWRENRRSRLASACIAHGVSLASVLSAAGIDSIDVLRANDASRLIAEVEAQDFPETDEPTDVGPAADEVEQARAELKELMTLKLSGVVRRAKWLDEKQRAVGKTLDQMDAAEINTLREELLA